MQKRKPAAGSEPRPSMSTFALIPLGHPMLMKLVVKCAFIWPVGAFEQNFTNLVKLVKLVISETPFKLVKFHYHKNEKKFEF